MEAAAFKTAWEIGNGSLCRFAPEDMATARIPDDARAFLQTTGLPAEAAPFLSFRPGDLQWLQADDLVPSMANCPGIGSDGGGVVHSLSTRTALFGWSITTLRHDVPM